MAKFKLSQTGYILRTSNEVDKIEKLTYRDYLFEFGSNETTTPECVAPRLYVDENSIYTWGVRGNNHRLYATFKNKTEATNTLYEIWENNVSEYWDAPYFATTLNEFYNYHADSLLL